MRAELDPHRAVGSSRAMFAPIRTAALGASVLAVTTLLSSCTQLQRSVRQDLNLPGRTDSRPFSHAVVVDDTVWIAGTLGLDPRTRTVPEDPAVEIRNALDGVRDKLALAGLTMDDLVSVQVFCSDVSLYGTFNDIYASYFDERYPVRAFIGSGELLFGARFEVQGVAAITR